MHPFPTAMLAAALGASFVGSAIGLANAPVTITPPASTSAGDLLLILQTYTSGGPPTASGNAASYSGGVSGDSYYLSGIATSNGNITLQGSGGGNSYLLLVFRGVTAVAAKPAATTTTPGTTFNTLGFTKSAACKAIITSCDQYNSTATPTTSATGFTSVASSPGSTAVMAAAYCLSPGQYGGGALTWNTKSGSITTDALMFELT